MSDIDTILENIELELERASHVLDQSRGSDADLQALISETTDRLVDLTIKGSQVTKEAGDRVGMKMRGVEAEFAVIVKVINTLKNRALVELCSRLEFKKEEPQQ